jgi:hypothetical protein
MIDISDIEDIEYEISMMDEKEETAKENKAQSEGAIRIHMKQLKDKYNLKSVAEASEFVENGLDNLDEQKQEIIDSFESIRKRFDELI